MIGAYMFGMCSDQAFQFLDEFVSGGYEGGQKLAATLKEAVEQHVRSIDQDASAYRIVVRVYGVFKILAANIISSATNTVSQKRTLQLFAGGFASRDMFFDFVDFLSEDEIERKVSGR